MPRRSEFKVIPARPKPALAAKRAKPTPQNRSIEHVVYGIGNLLHVRPLDDGSLVAVVEFNGVDRTIRLAPEYFTTPIPDIMKLAPHLAPPPAVKKKAKASAMPDEGDDEHELESAEVSEERGNDGQDDSGLSEPTWL
jgi:hypothetical protein